MSNVEWKMKKVYSLLQRDLLNLDPLLRFVAFDFCICDLVQHVQTLDHFREGNVLAVKRRIVLRDDEEVPARRTVRVLTHRDSASLLFHVALLSCNRPRAEYTLSVRTFLRPVSKVANFHKVVLRNAEDSRAVIQARPSVANKR